MIPRCFVCTEAAEAVEVIEGLQARPDVAEKTKQWLAQSVGKAREHLSSTDFSGSKFLSLLGVEPVGPLVVVSLCDDGVIMIEYLVRCSDGSNFSRHEALDLIPELPLPDELARRCAELRRDKPVTSYNDIWVGFEGPSIREY